MEYLTLTRPDFETIFDDSLSESAARSIEKYGFKYAPLKKEEHDAWVRRIESVLNDPNIVTAGEHRLKQWEDGWAENLAAFKLSHDISALIPCYFGKYKVVRWKGKFIYPLSDNFEYYTLAAIQDWLFPKYLAGAHAIYEFGCGTGHNLLRARRVNPSARLFGLDWARSSAEIIQHMVRLGLLADASGERFDLFAPDPNFLLHQDSAIYTVACLEQVETRFVPFVEFLISQRPKVCVHIEPIAELLDERLLLDRLSIAYFKKRKYLSGFLSYLQSQEKAQRIVIHRAQRTYIGSLFIEGYSVVVWSPR